jgi:hypothetical protein
MSTTTTSRRRSIAQGRALLAAWQASGLQPRAFCRAQGICTNRIDYWQRRLRRLDETATAPAQPSTFIQVQPVPPAGVPPAQAALTTTLPNGLIVAIHPGSDLVWSTQAIAALMRLRVEVTC